MKWGLPNPEANHPVDLGSGLAWLDMAYEKYRVAMEFHGQQHLEQYVADTRRMNALAAKNYDFIMASDEGLMIAQLSPDCIAIVKKFAFTMGLCGRPKEILETPRIECP